MMRESNDRIRRLKVCAFRSAGGDTVLEATLTAVVYCVMLAISIIPPVPAKSAVANQFMIGIARFHHVAKANQLCTIIAAASASLFQAKVKPSDTHTVIENGFFSNNNCKFTQYPQ